jgi:predicted transcriptional regulator of viral defense system
LIPAIRAQYGPGDGELAALSARQHGVVARRQLVELGLHRNAIQHRLATGRLHPLYIGVYAVGHRAIGPHGRWMAAVLACGGEGVLSHRSAAALWGLRPTSRPDVEVSAPRSRGGRKGIAVHRVRRLHPDDWAIQNGIPVTTVARTLLDLAEVTDRADLARAFEEAERLRLLDVRSIERLMRRSRGRRGLRPLAALIAQERAPLPATRSELERRFVEVCGEAGLPRPAVNVVVAGLEVDMVWADRKLAVELDGYAFHRTRAAFERDRIRDASLALAGYRVLRVTHRRLEHQPAAVAETVRSLLR